MTWLSTYIHPFINPSIQAFIQLVKQCMVDTGGDGGWGDGEGGINKFGVLLSYACFSFWIAGALHVARCTFHAA